VTDFSLEAITSLFEPTTGPSLYASDSPRVISPVSHNHARNLSMESASSFAGSHSSMPRLPNRSAPAVPSYSPSYEPYPKQSPQSRRRGNSDDEDHSDDLEALDPDATEDQKKEYKRRQNTLAARRSRAKKAHEIQTLRDENQKLRTDCAIWKERALMMERLLATHGVPCPSFSS
jgi:hypothetical protein